jgi:hypothetical protein
MNPVEFAKHHQKLAHKSRSRESRNASNIEELKITEQREEQIEFRN